MRNLDHLFPWPLNDDAFYVIRGCDECDSTDDHRGGITHDGQVLALCDSCADYAGHDTDPESWADTYHDSIDADDYAFGMGRY